MKPSNYITKAASIFIITITGLLLTGMLFNIPALKNILSGLANMKFNTAVCLLFSGTALLLLNQKNIGRPEKIIAFLLPGLVLLIASISLSQYVFGWNAGIDNLFYTDPTPAAQTIFPGRMPVATSVLLILFSLVLLLLRHHRYHFFIQIILITGMLFLVLIFLISITIISDNRASSVINNTLFHSRFIFLSLYFAAFFSNPLSYLKFSFQKKIAFFFIMVTLILSIIFFAYHRNNLRSVSTAKSVDHTNKVILQAEEIRTQASEMQNAIRGFLITGDEIYLPLFINAASVIDDHILRLKKLTKDNAIQQARVDTLNKLITGYTRSRNELIRLRRIASFDAEKIKLTLKEGKETIDRVRAFIVTIQQEENLFLVKRKAENEKNIQNSSRVITLFQFIAVMLLLVAFMVIYYNTRRRNKLEKEIKQNNIFLETILENIPSMIFIKEPEQHRFILVNKETEKMFGMSRKALLGKNDYDFFTKEEADKYFNQEKEIFTSKKTLEIPAELIHIGGRDHWLRRIKIPVYDNNRQPLYLIGISEDITEKKKAEEQLKEYKYFFDNSNDLCLIANEQGYFETITPKVEEVLGYSNREITETPFIQLVHPDDISSTLLVYDELKAGATVINFVNRYRKKDGTYLWFDWNASPNPATGKLYCIARDITERKILEDQLKQFNRELEKRVEEKTKEVIEKEQQYRFLLQNMREGIQVIGYDWKYLFVNNAVVEQGKYSNEELLGHTMMEKYPGIETTELFQTLQRCMKERTATVFENEFTFPDGTKEWFELSIQPVPEGLFVLSMDITERKKAENEKIRLLDTLQKSLNEIYIFSPHTLQFQYVNNGALSNLGYADEEIKKLTPLDLKPDFTEQQFKELIAPLVNGEQEKIVFFTHHKRKNGSLYPVEVHLQLIKQENQSVFLAVILDITERKKAEDEIAQMNKSLEKRAAELQASNTELERFAYVASHDLQEPLRMVSSFMGLLQKKYDDKFDDTGRSYIRFAVDGAERMKKLILDLLLFSRVDSLKELMQPVDCNELLAEVQQDLMGTITESKASIRVTSLPVVNGYKTQLQQVFQNLVNNAIKYRNEKPPLIEIGCLENETHWRFCVKDNGIGIDPKYFEKIFIIFQRLHNKDAFSGTGIGLTIARKIVERHGGKIWVESKPGKGSSFYFTVARKIKA
ncbi:MAG TPA: PAS domain S-box protein [Chitinophagaceae bacterium]|nr:PAS domain S-box protein [Chitinophagaceae bacterium]